MMGGNTEATRTRDRVLAAIRTASTPPTVEEMATSLGLHHNSVRLHAAALGEAGLITQDSRPGSGRGRPQVTYRTSTRGAWTGRRDYQLLASLLLSQLEGNAIDPATAARDMGREWGLRIAAARPTANRSNATARELTVAVLDELGFEPTPGEGGVGGVGGVDKGDNDNSKTNDDDDEIELRNCPFWELVDPRDGVICALHAGMLDGVADSTSATDAAQTAIELLPMSSSRSCTVRMRARSPRGG